MTIRRLWFLPSISKSSTDNYQHDQGLRALRTEDRPGTRDNLGINAYALGVIGSANSHTGLATAEEANFWGKMASSDTSATQASKSNRPNNVAGWSMQASGWHGLGRGKCPYCYLQRDAAQEVYGTTGPRIHLRFCRQSERRGFNRDD